MGGRVGRVENTRKRRRVVRRFLAPHYSTVGTQAKDSRGVGCIMVPRTDNDEVQMEGKSGRCPGAQPLTWYLGSLIVLTFRHTMHVTMALIAR